MGFLARLTFRSFYLLGQGRQFPVFLCLLPITQGSSFHRLSRTPRGFSMQMLFYSYILLFTPRCVRPLHLVLYEHCCRTPPLGLVLCLLQDFIIYLHQPVLTLSPFTHQVDTKEIYNKQPPLIKKLKMGSERILRNKT